MYYGYFYIFIFLCNEPIVLLYTQTNMRLDEYKDDSYN